MKMVRLPPIGAFYHDLKENSTVAAGVRSDPGADFCYNGKNVRSIYYLSSFITMPDNILGTDNVRWDLTTFYSDIDDPQIDADLADFAARAKAFQENYKGKLADALGPAIADQADLTMLGEKIMGYLFLMQSLDVTDRAVNAKVAMAQEAMSRAEGEFLTFFALELVALDDATLAAWYAKDEEVARHKPWIDHARIFKPHLLSEPVEAALTVRSPFGPGAWSEFFNEYEADLRFAHRDATKTLTEMLDILTNATDAAERAEALTAINDGLGGTFGKYAAHTLYMIAGEAAVERRTRGYGHPMEARNKDNRIPDAVVETLHHTVKDVAGPLARRYYRLKARLMGKETLPWSDRNAPLPAVETAPIPFDNALTTVLDAYRSFSPTLATIIEDLAAHQRIDAAARVGKHSGAFNSSLILPGRTVQSFTLLNYLGSGRDVMILAHELGHAVHGVLAGQAQGPLMANPPIAFCETASVFGEMTAFTFLRGQLAAHGDTAALLNLLMRKIEEMLNTVVRQIGFPNFERRLHGMDAAYASWSDPVKRSTEDLDAIWLTTLKELYGEEGDVFTYAHAEHQWAYISHFHSPFYVYGYTFGELLTQSLYAKQKDLGDRFEPLYLDLLRAGGTKDAVQLLAPFGLDPTSDAFWSDGIRVSLATLIDEAERLTDAINLPPRS
jgi:oligoendopeptidase F